ncbi:leucine-rich repeat protein [Metamycoplasma hominis]|uniref:leucine-rich repeat domain-containing protein n=1 Tax=Metamycoplasma hominis TaxID=2098 RepID=UPI003CF1166E
MKNKKNSKIWLILSSISTLTAILPLAAISCDHKVKQNSKENNEDLKPDENKPEPKPENPTKEDLKPDENKPEPKPENPTKEEDSSNLNKTFKFELTKSNTWKIAKYIGNDSEVIIPKEYQGKNITEIGNGAFSNSVIQSVTIPSSIKKIGDYAFEYSQNLKDVVLNEGLEEIGQYAFFGSSLTSVVIPNSTKKIGGAAFDYWNPFINIKNANFEIRHNFLIDKRDRKILAYLDRNATKVVIPTWIKKIGDVAFNRCENIKEVILNEGLEKIGDGAFWNTHIESITIPSSVKEIEECALPTWNISSILIDSNNKNFEIKDNFFIDKNNKKILGYLDKKTSKVTIPNNVKEIGDCAFSGCRNLKEVILNEGLEKIGAWAFEDTKIESITIPSSIKEIGDNAFYGCKNLKEIILNEGLEKIGYEAFRDTNIDSITIPSSVKEIGEGALSNSNISSILINSNNKNFEIKDNFFIDKNNKKILAYLDKKTTKVTIPNNVKEIGDSAFLGCKNLKEVILNEGLERIGAEAFQNLPIELVYIPSSVKEIEYSSFSNCKNLKEVILNEGLEKIDADAFLNTNIESITIPGSVKEIGESAFYGCKNLKEVILNEGLERIGAKAFSDTNIKLVNIPNSIKILEDSAFDFSIILHSLINSNNKNFEIKDNFFIDKNNKKILAYLDKKTTKVVIPNNVKKIGESAFSNCENLKEVSLNEGLEKIGAETFYDTKIESITIPGSVKEIGERAFCNCENLKEVILNEGLKKIGASAFPNTKIESITIPSSVKEIGESAFSNCKNLKEVIYKGDASNINWKNIGIDKTKIKIISSNN